MQRGQTLRTHDIGGGEAASDPRLKGRQVSQGSGPYTDDESDHIDYLRRRPKAPQGEGYASSSKPLGSRNDDPQSETRTPHKRSPAKSFDLNERFGRKSVCVRCWETDSRCDVWGQCGPCRIHKVKCVHKMCSSGLSCRSTRCPYMHPGQWDENDTNFIVEEGPLPGMKIKAERSWR